MNFKMKKIATAVAAGLGASIVGMSVSQSDEIFFPYIVRSPTVTSVVSVVNIEPSGASPTAQQLHYVYFHKSGADATSNTASCIELNFRRRTSSNDIQTFDVGTRFAQDNLGVLFNDPSINNNYLGANLSYSGLAGIGATPDQSRAFLLVDNNDTVGGSSVQGSLYGEAVLLDFAAGAAWGYRAYNSIVDEALIADGQLSPGSFSGANTFSNQFETEGEVLNGAVPADGQTPVHLLPDDEFVVRFFVTPVADSTDDDSSGVLEIDELGDQRTGNLTTTVRLFIDADSIGNGVAFDRDENPISGPLQVPVTCVAGVDVRNVLLSQGVLNQLKQAGSDGGGWSFFQTLDASTSTSTQTPEAVVFRLDFNRANTFDGTTFVDSGDAFNAAVWLRNGTDRNVAYEALVPVPTYDVVTPATPTPWGADGIPNLYFPTGASSSDSDG